MSSKSLSEAILQATLDGQNAKVVTPYVPSKGKNTGPQDMVKTEYCIPVDISGNGSWLKNAQAWDQYHEDPEGNDIVWIFQFMLMAAQYTALGTPKILTNNPKKYHKILNAYVKEHYALSKRLTKSEQLLLKTYVEKGYVFNTKQYLDIKKTLHKLKKKDANEQDDGEKEREFNIYNVCPPSFDIINNTGVRPSFLNNNNNNNDDEADDDLEEQQQQNVYTEKIKFYVIPIPKTGGDPKNRDDIVGYLLRFIQIDPSWNPGALLQKLILDVKERSTAVYGGKPTGSFTNYAHLFNSTHPVANASIPRYIRFVNSYTEVENGDYSAQKDTCVADFKDPLHLNNILTLKKALKWLKKAGGDPAYLNSTALWYDFEEKTAIFPDGLDSYLYLPQQVCWKMPGKVYLFDQYFPDVRLDDNFMSFVNDGNDPHDFFGGGNDRTLSKIKKYLRDTPVIDKKYLNNDSGLNYETYNIFMHLYKDTQDLQKKIYNYFPGHYLDTFNHVQSLLKRYGKLEWRNQLSDDMVKRVEECEVYNKFQTEAKKCGFNRFLTLWQTKGNVDTLPISPSLRNILKWYIGWNPKTLTRKLRLYDRQLDFFGNSVLFDMEVISHIFKVIHASITLDFEALMCSYEFYPGQIKFNMIIHGEFDAGKTYAGITVPMKMYIPGTIHPRQSITAASDKTQRHRYDDILVSDETEDFKVNKEAAKREQNRVNAEKLKLTGLQLSTEVFMMIDMPDGTKARWSADIITDHLYSRLEITNQAIEGEDALSSRYYGFTVKKVHTPANELDYKAPPIIDSESKKYFQINQYLSAAGRKAEWMGGVLAPNTDLFKDISNKVIAYLKITGSVPNHKGSRPLEIMLPKLRQYIWKMAIHYTFDSPGSPYYMQEFNPSMLKYMEQFLYSTVSMTWKVWTDCAEKYIQYDRKQVLMAMLKLIGLKGWTKETCAYSIFENDSGKSIPFKKSINPKYQDTMGIGTDKYLLDINYLGIKGNLTAVSRQIADHTYPKMSPDDVKAQLENLMKHHVMVDGGAYEDQPEDTFREWHALRPKSFVNEETQEETVTKVKKTGLSPKEMGRYYVYGRVEDTTFNDRQVPSNISTLFKVENGYLGKEHVSRLPEDTMLPVVKRGWVNKEAMIYFMPSAVFMFDQELILEALYAATLCKSFRPGKYILGFTDPNDPQLLRVSQHPEQQIKDHVLADDLNNGWERRDGKPIFVGGQAGLDVPLPRQSGIRFNRRSFMPSVTQSLFSDGPIIGKLKEDESAEKYKTEMSKVSQFYEDVKDLDEWSATIHHIKCGYALDEPVKTPEWILNNYLEGCAKHDINPYGSRDYPNLKKRQMAPARKIWTNSCKRLNFEKPDTLQVRDERRTRKKKKKRPRTQSKKGNKLQKVMKRIKNK